MAGRFNLEVLPTGRNCFFCGGFSKPEKNKRNRKIVLKCIQQLIKINAVEVTKKTLPVLVNTLGETKVNEKVFVVEVCEQCQVIIRDIGKYNDRIKCCDLVKSLFERMKRGLDNPNKELYKQFLQESFIPTLMSEFIYNMRMEFFKKCGIYLNAQNGSEMEPSTSASAINSAASGPSTSNAGGKHTYKPKESVNITKRMSCPVGIQKQRMPVKTFGSRGSAIVGTERESVSENVRRADLNDDSDIEVLGVFPSKKTSANPYSDDSSTEFSEGSETSFEVSEHSPKQGGVGHEPRNDEQYQVSSSGDESLAAENPKRPQKRKTLHERKPVKQRFKKRLRKKKKEARKKRKKENKESRRKTHDNVRESTKKDSGAPSSPLQEPSSSQRSPQEKVQLDFRIDREVAYKERRPIDPLRSIEVSDFEEGNDVPSAQLPPSNPNSKIVLLLPTLQSSNPSTSAVSIPAIARQDHPSTSGTIGIPAASPPNMNSEHSQFSVPTPPAPSRERGDSRKRSKTDGNSPAKRPCLDRVPSQPPPRAPAAMPTPPQAPQEGSGRPCLERVPNPPPPRAPAAMPTPPLAPQEESGRPQRRHAAKKCIEMLQGMLKDIKPFKTKKKKRRIQRNKMELTG